MIPRKLYDRLQTSLLEFRNNPGPATDARLLADEEECCWPWAANAEQLQDWQGICDRTRLTFEAAVLSWKKQE